MDKVLIKSDEFGDITFVQKVLKLMAENLRGDIEVGMVLDDGQRVDMTILLRGITGPDGTYHEV